MSQILLTCWGIDWYPLICVCKTSLIFFLQTCLTTYYGLWKGCTKTLWVADIDPERESCGPAELPGGYSKIYWLVGWMSDWLPVMLVGQLSVSERVTMNEWSSWLSVQTNDAWLMVWWLAGWILSLTNSLSHCWVRVWVHKLLLGRVKGYIIWKWKSSALGHCSLFSDIVQLNFRLI